MPGVVRGAILLSLVLGSSTAAASPTQTVPATATWEQFVHVPAVVDVAGPRRDGRLIVAAHGRLLLMDTSGHTSEFAPTYSVPDGPEPYIALSPGLTVDGAGCAFERDDVFALDLHDASPGVTRISASGDVSHLADVAGVTTLLGIALDTVGQFGHRLLVIGPTQQGATALMAIDCRGAVSTIGVVDVALEGGLEVAPATFGSFGGQLIAPNEHDGTIYAVSPTGVLSTVAASGVPAGQDIGVESAGFVPVDGAPVAYVADRGGQPDPHAGTDSLLRLTSDQLATAGVRPGDLLVGRETAGRGPSPLRTGLFFRPRREWPPTARRRTVFFRRERPRDLARRWTVARPHRAFVACVLLICSCRRDPPPSSQGVIARTASSPKRPVRPRSTASRPRVTIQKMNESSTSTPMPTRTAVGRSLGVTKPFDMSPATMKRSMSPKG